MINVNTTEYYDTDDNVISEVADIQGHPNLFDDFEEMDIIAGRQNGLEVRYNFVGMFFHCEDMGFKSIMLN